MSSRAVQYLYAFLLCICRNTMNRRSSSTPSLQRPPDFTKTPPFVPRELFRLVLRLEAQKALDVNVAALEQRFRVPPGYADDDSLNARGEAKQPKNFVPGPGTYEVPEQWPLRDVTATPTAAFLSRTTREPFSPARRVASAPLFSPTRQVIMEELASEKVVRPYTANAALEIPSRMAKSPRTRLRLPSSSDRRKLLIDIPEPQHNQPEDTPTSSSYSSLNPQNASTFSKLGREPEVKKTIAPPVGSYDIKRLWDSNDRRVNARAPSPAVFGASTEKRVVMWRPALTPASYTLSTSWDSSRHYAKKKNKVARSAAKRKLRDAKAPGTLSSPTLQPSTANANNNESAADVPTEMSEDNDDPFSWLRQRPNGENRVNFLAAKHGLGHHIKSPTRRMTEYRRSTLSYCGDQVSPGTPSSRLVHEHSNLQDDGDAVAAEAQYTAKAKDVRIKVSCRMPGGMLISASVYSMKKLGHFKSAILARQNRFQAAEQFDLYHMSGKKLTGLDDTLAACGVRDRCTLQIVPVVGIGLIPQVNTSGSHETKQ
ncbi:hypothetical protein V7S43_003103 [Phytophthora oleae]|uniref:Ubiquitin-like domain-containing protein n=1 Tax=Phytophthora oleae TaxID=2107226 RepID=A0ABD3G1T4_9STRA